jgi:hypothetical protein
MPAADANDDGLLRSISYPRSRAISAISRLLIH